MNDNQQITLTELIRTIKRIGDLHAPSLQDHENRTSEYAVMIGEELNGGERLSPEKIILLGYGSDIHDFGKIYLRDSILEKIEKLNDSEMEHVKTHTRKGFESFEFIEAMPYEVSSCIRYHQEHYDGSGYEGLQGLDIPLFPRIVCLADVWDALLSRRAWRPGFPREDAMAEMQRCSAWFDPMLFAVFLRLYSEGRL